MLDCLASHRGAIADKALAVTTRLDADLQVFADAERLAQVFGNLLQNTLRYTDAPARLTVTLAAAGGEAVLRWEDSAPGVPAADLPPLRTGCTRRRSRARSSGAPDSDSRSWPPIVEAHRAASRPSRQSGRPVLDPASCRSPDHDHDTTANSHD